MSESTPYKCVNCFLGLTSMQTWKFAHVSPLCVSCYDSLCEQKRGKQPEPLADCIAANLALPRFYGTRPATLPETLPAGLVIKVAGVVIRLLEPARLIARGCAYDCPARAVKCEGDKAEEVLSRSDGAVIPLGWLDWATVPIQKVKPVARTSSGETVFGAIRLGGLVSPGIRRIKMPTINPPLTCRDCSAPATTERGYCVYCSNRVGWGQSYFSESEIGYAMQIHKHRENDQARARMLAADERERPKSSATSREMAKAHPWEEAE